MQRSNLYIIIYAIGVSAICGGLLAFASQSLKSRQDANVAFEQKQNILSTVTVLEEGADVEGVYADKINSYVIDSGGNRVEGVEAELIDLELEYKKPNEERLLPVYEYVSDTDSTQVDYVVLPLYGFGLWDNIWGFLALQSDYNTIQGVKFDHAGETPGLGARINTDDIQDRYKGKEIFDAGTIIAVKMQKGEGNDYAGDPHKVDGMSGATLTANGVNNMLIEYLNGYRSYLDNNRP